MVMTIGSFILVAVDTGVEDGFFQGRARSKVFPWGLVPTTNHPIKAQQGWVVDDSGLPVLESGEGLAVNGLLGKYVTHG